ncbi:MAG: phosphoenolpyruvate--protein phosphotransferase [Candidatus Ratteibacteria bacterium]|nr:phosphoenolpyruvate--protein phosphotransferase [Candidatus Ratteibacteria bacterium]
MLIKGVPASPGIVVGKAFVLKPETLTIPKYKIPQKEIADEIKRYMDALSLTRGELIGIQKKVEKELGESYPDIFSAHLLILDDPALREKTINIIEKENINAENAVAQVLEKIGMTFSKIEDKYLRERAQDFKDVGRRILKNLLGKQEETLANLADKVIIVAHDLAPSETAQMDKKNVLGFATDVGGRTSHTAIMARSLTIPAVVGLGDITQRIESGERIVIDGHEGVAVINPPKTTLERYLNKKKQLAVLEKKLNKLRKAPAQTTDGHIISLMANIELPKEVELLDRYGAEGVGLYRTEFFFLNRSDIPSEEEQFQAYKYAAERAYPLPIVIRTLDLGGDKFASVLETPKEINPFLGWRAIRFCLARPDIFKTQLRAILRASVYGKVSVMYPLISTLQELRQANKFLEEVKVELKKEKREFSQKIKIGAMIETPSAAITADLIAQEVDFFSIGTNDLIQYAMAVDRINEKIAYLYQPASPAVLRFIKHIVDSGHRKGIKTAVCGEIAGDINLTLILLGLGVDELSMGPVAIPEVKQIIRSVSIEEARKITEKAMSFDSTEKVVNYLKSVKEPLKLLYKSN